MANIILNLLQFFENSHRYEAGFSNFFFNFEMVLCCKEKYKNLFATKEQMQMLWLQNANEWNVHGWSWLLDLKVCGYDKYFD